MDLQLKTMMDLLQKTQARERAQKRENQRSGKQPTKNISRDEPMVYQKIEKEMTHYREDAEKEKERDREIWGLKEALRQQQEAIQVLKGESEKTIAGDEPEPYREKKNEEEAPYREDNEREREYREVVQHQQETIEKLIRVVEQYPERVNASSERVGEPHTVIAKQNKPQSVGERLDQGETQGTSEETAQISSLIYGVSQSPSTSVNLKGSKGSYHIGHNSLPESASRNEILNTPDRLRVIGDCIEALNQQLSEDRKKTQREREASRKQGAELGRSIKTLWDRLQRAEGVSREAGAKNLVNEREIESVTPQISREAAELPVNVAVIRRTPCGDLPKNSRESGVQCSLETEQNRIIENDNICNGERVPRRRRHSVGRSETQRDRDRTESESEGSQGTSSHRKRRKTICRGRGADRNDPEPREREIRALPQKIPQVLCEKFGDAPIRDFKTFEREFREMCDLYSIPESQKLTRFKLHLEGNVLKHTNSWLDAHGGPDLTYDQLVNELRTSYQRDLRPEEALQKLQGRIWNVFETTINEFVHDTRVLVQLAYPNEHDLWDRKIESFIKLALPDTLTRFLSVLGPVSVSDMTEWIRDNTNRIDLSQEPNRFAEGWVQHAYRESQANKTKNNVTSGKRGTTIEICDNNEGCNGNLGKSESYNASTHQGPSPMNFSSPTFRGLCYNCWLPGHRKAFCTAYNLGPWRAGHHGQGTHWNGGTRKGNYRDYLQFNGPQHGASYNQERNWNEPPYLGNHRLSDERFVNQDRKSND
ncbi:MAG: hypothetical protein GY820_18440, partial [Gammaproteobacteria bacterium]|nr:hypothetical protein [Gammaproteobacteria bacterium]